MEIPKWLERVAAESTCPTCRSTGDKIIPEMAEVRTGIYQVLRKVMAIIRCAGCGHWAEVHPTYNMWS